jgi:hypothetical protein
VNRQQAGIARSGAGEPNMSRLQNRHALEQLLEDIVFGHPITLHP